MHLKRKLTDPVSCDFYDELEAASTRRDLLTLTYRDTQDVKHSCQGRIIDLYTALGTEWAKLDTGEVIELSRIIEASLVGEEDLPERFLSYPDDIVRTHVPHDIMRH